MSARLKTVMGDSAKLDRRAADDVVEILATRGHPRSTLPAEMAKDPLLTPAEIAKFLKVDPKTVSRWASRGKFGEAPGVIRLPGHNGARRIRTSAYNEAMRKANEGYGN